MALEKRNPDCALRFWARPASVEKTQRAFPSAVVSSQAAEIVREARILVFCCPVGAMELLAKEIVESISDATLITDAGSVKASVVGTLEPIFGGRFVGAHPMAGSEQSGIEFANADLFEGATCVLTPTAKTEKSALSHISDFWTSVGCKNLVETASEHDRLVARSSHLPHAVASILAKSVEGSLPAALGVTGSGFRDTTRVASGPPGMWAEIFLENRLEVLASLRELHSEMRVFANLLETGDRCGLEKFLLQARDVRNDLK